MWFFLGNHPDHNKNGSLLNWNEYNSVGSL